MIKKENPKDVPRGRIRRSGIIGVAAAKAGLKRLEYISKKPFLSKGDKAESLERNDEEIARMIFSAVGMLKGAPVKLAQIFSMEMERLPEAYQKELLKSTSQVPPINRALIRNIIKRELGDWPERIFQSFNPLPFAAASLGQVHRAASHDGDALAVKVQYPGIAEGVRSDIAMARSILRMTPYSWLLDGAVKEVERGITEELDYRIEAKNTEFFRKNIGTEDVIVPEVYEELSAEHVLTTSFIEGIKLDDWLAQNPGQEKRDHYGKIFCDLFSTCLNKNHLIHADPNIGNFLFRNDGRLGLIDFGCVMRLEEDFMNRLKAFIRATGKKGLVSIEDIHAFTGISYKRNNGDKESREFISGWVEFITRPIRTGYFDFAENADYFNETKKFIPRIYNYIDGYEGGVMYFGRTMYGLYRILHRLGTRLRMEPV